MDERTGLYDELLDLVDPEFLALSGEVFLSGRSSFESAAPVYLLGLNPGGHDFAEQPQWTVARNLEQARMPERAHWSAYSDESWGGRPPGSAPFQRRVLHLLAGLDLDPRAVPSSNVVFVRTASEADLPPSDKARLLRACWTVHARAVEALDVRVVLALGATAGGFVREQSGAHALIDDRPQAHQEGRP